MKRCSVWTRAAALSLLIALGLTSLAGCQDAREPAPETSTTTDSVTTASPATEPLTDAATDAVTDAVTTEEATTAIPEVELTVDQSYRIVISAEATEMTRRAADQMAAAFKEKAGLELTVVTDAEAPAEHELVLGQTNRLESDRVDDYALFINGESIHLDAENPTTLYYALTAVLDTWLTPDFGLTQAGAVTLKDSRLVDLNHLTHEFSNSIRVMTQNMRDGDDPNGNTVQKRFDRFCLLLADYQPDIIGTQEHSNSWYIRFNRLFEGMTGEEDIPLYALVGESMNGYGATGGARNAIMYRVDRFDLVETGTFWLSETPDISSTMGHGVAKRTCTWALLKDKRTDTTILAVNTHLDHTSEDIRLRQIQVILDYLAANVGDYPLFFTGDFNASSRSSSYGLVSETLTDARETAGVNLSTVSGTFHNYHEGGFGSVIDHVFYNDKATPVTYEIVSKSYGGFVSDHYGVLVEFVLN